MLPVPLAFRPVTVPVTLVVHVYVVPDTDEVGMNTYGVPEQRLSSVSAFVIAGIGLTTRV
jgi:hypothetical protein